MHSGQESLNIALVQYPIAWEDKKANFKIVEDLLRASKESIDIVILPEMFNTGFSMNRDSLKETMEGPTLEWMHAIAKEYKILICGSLMIYEGEQCFNRFIATGADGLVAQYDKRYLFTPASENKFYSQGTERLTFEYLGWRICPLICYDLRFPVWSYNDNAIDLYLYVANWPKPRIEHWKKLLAARAIENQSYVAGVNRVGSDGNGLEYIGGSQLIDYHGEVKLALNNKWEMGIVTISKKPLIAFRTQMDFLGDQDGFILKI